jgi:hypothetical protein
VYIRFFLILFSNTHNAYFYSVEIPQLRMKLEVGSVVEKLISFISLIQLKNLLKVEQHVSIIPISILSGQFLTVHMGVSWNGYGITESISFIPTRNRTLYIPNARHTFYTSDLTRTATLHGLTVQCYSICVSAWLFHSFMAHVKTLSSNQILRWLMNNELANDEDRSGRGLISGAIHTSMTCAKENRKNISVRISSLQNDICIVDLRNMEMYCYSLSCDGDYHVIQFRNFAPGYTASV